MPDAFAIDSRFLLQHHLIEPETDMVHSQRGDVVDVALCDVGVEMFEISDGERKAAFHRKHIETFIVGEPSSDAHSVHESLEVRHLFILSA